MVPRIVIIGSGLAGLTTAFRLRSRLPDAEITILEGRSRYGGNIGTENAEGFRYEIGPNGFLDSKPSTKTLCHDLGLDSQLITASESARKNRWLQHTGAVTLLPSSPLGLLRTPLLSPLGKLSLLWEPLRRRGRHLPEDESIADFARRRFGQEAADVFIDALVTGIHAGNPKTLSLKGAFPNMARYEQQSGSVVRGMLRNLKEKRRQAEASGKKAEPQRMWSFRAGLQVLVDTLFMKSHANLITDDPVVSVKPEGNLWRVVTEQRSYLVDAVVSAAPAHAQKTYLSELDPELGRELNAIAFNKIAVAVLGWRKDQVRPEYDGFGYLTTTQSQRNVLGVQWCSAIFPERAPEGFVLWRVLCGGARHPGVLNQDDASFLQVCVEEMKKSLGVQGNPHFQRVVRWPQAIPQYEIGHLQRVDRIEAAFARHSGLFPTGNSFRGIAINDVTEHAEQTADKVTTYLHLRAR